MTEIPDIAPSEKKVICGQCGSPMELRSSKYGLFWGCTQWPDCDGTHAAHQKTGLPMGTPADKETKQWRMKAHNIFDIYWKKWGLDRNEAYSLLATALHIPRADAHIAMFDIEQCKKVIKICEDGLGGAKNG